VRPEDALAAVRSAILLGAVVPTVRSAADQLAADLNKLVALRSDQERERDRLQADAASLAEGRRRIALLLEDKRRQSETDAAALTEEQKRMADLASQATTLRELVARLEQARPAAPPPSATTTASVRPRSLGSADRLAPAIAFDKATGLLPMPANGRILTAYGAPNGLGGKSQGISLATRPGAEIVAPADGWIAYAGEFRSYGQLLIINAGGGYYVLLAGMERIDVQLGQFVLAGEPVAAMASQRLASVGATLVGTTEPVLYVEFRKDGASIDPAPWWAASNPEKVGG
jgi:septal ring factor EnvC (AmiA/AmiB activator)